MKKEFLKAVESHQGIIHKVCKMYRDGKEDQEDLFQEIVLQLWKAFPNFRNESKVSTWIYRIALNTAIAVFRKNKVDLEFKDKLPADIYSQQGDESSENEVRMFASFRTLNKAERAVIALYLDEYSYKEIAEIIGTTDNNVAVIISRVKAKLKKILN